MNRPVEVKALNLYKIWVRYSDGQKGSIDLSDLAGQGVFSVWENPEFFKKVQIGPGGAIMWGDQIDLCPDALYIRLTKKKPEELNKNN